MSVKNFIFFLLAVGNLFSCVDKPSWSEQTRFQPKLAITNFMKQFVTNPRVALSTPEELNGKYYLAGFDAWSVDSTRSSLDDSNHLQRTEKNFFNRAFLDATSVQPVTVKTDQNKLTLLVGKSFGLKFRRESDNAQQYQLEQFASYDDNVDRPATLLHFSVSPDQARISLVISLPDYEPARANPVATIVFAKIPEGRHEKAFHPADPRYKYLHSHRGKTYPLSTRAIIVFNFCVQESMPKALRENVSRSIEQAVNEWQAVLGNKAQLRYNGEDYACEAPGSVLGTHNIYVMPEVKTRGPGVTALASSFERFEKTLLPGSAYILLFPQWGDPTWTRTGEGLTGKNVVRHEIGHVLGLGHMETIRSTMSHFSPASELTDYDRAAINSLY